VTFSGGEDSGQVDVGVVDPDTPIVIIDASPSDVAVCISECSDRECGGDGCGGVCGTCEPGSACSAGVCVPRGGGGGDCSEIIECVQDCTTEECWQRCMEEGAPEAQEEFIALLTCIDEECSRFEDDQDRFAECQQEECGDMFNECFDIPIGGGDLDCAEVIECIFGCRTDECQQRCFVQATPEGQEQLEDLFFCAQSVCSDVDSPAAWRECSQEFCPEEFGMCFEQDVPSPPTEGCSDREMLRLDELGEDFRFVVVECGFSCIESDDETRCASACMGRPTGVSESCGDCLGEYALCLANDCGDVCNNPNSDECVACDEETCSGSFFSCVEGP
jgi:hypothetical protein